MALKQTTHGLPDLGLGHVNLGAGRFYCCLGHVQFLGRRSSHQGFISAASK